MIRFVVGEEESVEMGQQGKRRMGKNEWNGWMRCAVAKWEVENWGSHRMWFVFLRIDGERNSSLIIEFLDHSIVKD